MKQRKQYIGVILSALLLSSLLACSKKTSFVNDAKQTITEEVKQEDHTTETTAKKDGDSTKEENVTVTPESEPENTDETSIQIPEFHIETKQYETNDALQFVKNMKVGWNLGNTFDASSDTNNSGDELKYESSWCGVVTTQEMITSVKEAGFQTIRIPVSWHNHVSGEDFTISDVWLNRVQEVVDYAVNEDMYIILNIHHDTMQGYYYPSKDQYETSAHYMECIWSQLSERFADYDEHLIFEGINEPRLKGTNYEWWLDMNNDQCKEAVDCVNRLNQVFVDTVRSTGGNNATRYLMVPGYCASSEYALLDQFVMPTDLNTNENKIIVSVHAYTPYNFALQKMNESGSTSEFSISNQKGTKEIDSFIDRLFDKFISKGTPVVIGEFGAMDKGGNVQARTEFTAYYVKSASVRGMSCIWWDNNSFGGSGENFGLFSRRTMIWRYPDIENALIQYSER